MAHVVQRWQQMSARDKLDQVAAANRSCEQLAEAGVRVRHPDASHDEVRLRVLALRLGRDLMAEAYGWDPAGKGW
jgi:hypothetical protein